jgi:copper/silver efflux system protein
MGAHTLIGRVIAASVRHRFLTLIVAAALAVWGAWSLRKAPLDAIPDLSDVQVIVFTEWMGRGPDLVEDQVTTPIATALLAAPHVHAVRGQSMFGMSFVYVLFEDGTDLYWARSRVLEYLSGVQGRLPEGVTPTLGPDATGVGWVYEYALVDHTGTHDQQELRSLQDWTLRYALESVPGVAQVASIGGFVKQYQVDVDPDALLALHVPFDAVMDAVRDANSEVGGRVVEIAGTENVVRGRGYVQKPDDIAMAPVTTTPGGVPVRVGDVAEVTLGPAQRRGVADLDGHGETVGGIVIMRHGENALRVIDRVKARMAEIAPSLPPGGEIVPTYDRSELIEAAVDTLRTTVLEEIAIVSLVIVLFLLHGPTALVPIVALPLAVLAAFIPLYYQGLTVNIMSLGGIAVAIGAMVDASVILVENVHKKLEGWEAEGRQGNRSDVIVAAMQEVGPSAFFALLVITVSFIPIFTLEATEGRLFAPLAFTKTYAMAFAALFAVTLTPALAVLFIRGRTRREDDNPINRWLVAAYTPVVRFVVRYRFPVITAAALAVASTVPVALSLGSEFMPPLNEGVILYMPTAPPGISEGEAARVLQTVDQRLTTFPEVVRVFGKMGRAETPTDPAPLSMMETIVLLKPRAEWRPGVTWDGLIREMDAAMQIPGMPNAWWMPIQTRTEMLATGIRSPLGIKVFGDTRERVEEAAIAIEKAVATVPGTRSAFADRSGGGRYADITVDRFEAGRFGLSVRAVNEIVQSAIGGMDVSQAVEARARYPIAVRYAREFRDDPEALGRVYVSTPAGAQVPLSRVADVDFRVGPDMIRTEGGKLVGYVFVDPGERAIAGYVTEAKRVVGEQVALPQGVRIEWAGQFQYLERARARLMVVVPLTIAFAAMLLWFNTGSAVETAIVLLAVPFSLIGAFWLLWLLGYNLSVAVWVGLIALAGLDAETGVIMLLYLTLAHAKHAPKTFAELTDAITDGAARRVRPKLMTVLCAMVGLLPVLWSTGAGADVMKRIAAPMVGGLATSFLLELLVYPAMFAVWKGRALSVTARRR